MSNNQTHVLVRVDANHQMGIGHAMRCLALAEELVARGIPVTFVMAEIPAKLEPRLKSAEVRLIKIQGPQTHSNSLIGLATSEGASHLVFDGYHLTDTYVRDAKKAGFKILRFDDYMPEGGSSADVIVNASPHADTQSYQRWAPHADLLLGPQFITYRSDMIEGYKKRQKMAKSASDAAGDIILVNFGGSDPLDMTIETVKALSEAIPGAEIEAVTGAAYPSPDRLASLDISGFKHHHNTNNLPSIMKRARLAISAGGLTVQELALFRIPTILAITAENQIKGAHVTWCHTLNLAFNHKQPDTAGMIREIVREAAMLWQSPAEREKIVKRIPAELDISGASRIAQSFIGN